MDDDNIEEHMFFPPGMPEELKEQIKAHVREHHDNHMIYRHQVVYFLQSLKEEQLSVIKDMFVALETQDNAATAGFYQGLIASLLSDKFGHCIACGSKHEDELHKIVSEGTVDTDNSVPKPWPDLVTGLDTDTRKNLADYRLNIVTQDYPKVACRDCGMIYQSLEDRMLKAPEDCIGCIQKEKWG